MQFTDESTDQANIAFKIVAYENTWSNQRRKRRENKKKKEETGESTAVDPDSPPSKKIRIDEEKTDTALPKSSIVEFLILITEENGSVALEFPWLSGDKGLIFQILQYFKNNGINEKES